ncbi:hypothetical protein L4D06_10055 [Enterovibrio makurazakiensis]|uniref:Uncharacterized protein n=1 Tax=Enterovibrio gelatinilyticus TaxID=2899819 RepID=A0ABT5R3V2_9GAMM|nr:hypothetical protein [Enterovibrio sp. ZSDZ42]MDD1794941.1 hypothetical protein [Enterovibrio sp. ZSDZ42]
MGHKRISNKKIQQMLHDIMPEDAQKTKDDSLVEGKTAKGNDETPLKLDNEQK